jgi:hypothetical protein
MTVPGPSLAALGRLEIVPPRDVWPHEALNFTPWLLDNVDVLSTLLGMELVLEAAEHPVGGFSLDLIGRDETTGQVVIVENQLEISDHTHLGQISPLPQARIPRRSSGWRLASDPSTALRSIG